MGGAPITVTLWADGISVSHARTPLVHHAGWEAELRRALDAGEDVEASLFSGKLAPVLGLAQVAVDCVWVEDRRHEPFPHP